MNEPEVRRLSEVREELDPQGDKVDKDDLLGEDLQIRKVKPWTNNKGKQVCRVIAVVVSSGELVHFSGGEPMWNSIKDFQDQFPLTAQIVKVDHQPHPFYILE